LPDFNREMLILARECRGLTQTDLAEEVQMSQAEISKFETGMKVPMPEQARRMASRLRFSVDFFYLNESKRDFGSGCMYYHRKRKSAAEGVLRRLLALVNVRRIQIKQLLASVNPKNKYELESLDLDEYGNNAGNVARALRSVWRLPPGPVQNVTEIIEEAGCIVLRTNFGTDKVDAISQWLPGWPPIFLINDRIPMDRTRWTLVHELGHIVMHRFPTDNMEREADEFAAEFLMPTDQIKPHLYGVTLAGLAALKPFWRVSMAALLKRASDLSTITPRTKQYLWAQMGMRGYRTHEPVPIPGEQPTLLRELFEFHHEKLGHDQTALAKIMKIDEAELSQEFFGSKPVRGLTVLPSAN
jgi:Zn-dependent peptidase ImmA (M78 family)/DNA-binding XRE family transcriptional regulator